MHAKLTQNIFIFDHMLGFQIIDDLQKVCSIYKNQIRNHQKYKKLLHLKLTSHFKIMHGLIRKS